jgi:hypothetical protein
MACYSYSSGLQVYFNNNIEKVHTASGTTYSYSEISWVCEWPVNEQLLVYTRSGPAGAETLKVLNTDYTINEGTSNIVFNSAVNSGQVVIRRNTLASKMIFRFLDGAKLTSKELNANFHQLLFAIQEKEFLNATINNYFPPSGSFITITNAPVNPIELDLAGIAIGKALVWNGSKFIVSNFSSTLDALTDVDVTGAGAGNLLRFDGTNWIDIAPSFDITSNNPVIPQRIFNTNNSNVSYSTGTPLTISGSSLTALNEFKSGTNWVVTDPPTVYHVIQKVLPSNQDPITFFTNVQNSIDSFSTNIGNPVKVKFFWNLNAASYCTADQSDNLDLTISEKTAFWGCPNELYSTSGFASSSSASSLKYHAVTDNASSKHRHSPYFYHKLNNADVTTQYVSKIHSYGVASFYLSVPECKTTCLQIASSRSFSAWVTLANSYSGNLTSLTDALTDLGNDTNTYYRDYYLMGLRDMAFAGSKPDSSFSDPASTVKARDANSRYHKAKLISADYQGFDNIDFKRLESGEASQSVLWKIPSNIIYYNKAALALANNDVTDLNTSSSLPLDTTRFSGRHLLQGTSTNTISTLTETTNGKIFKADKLWTAWQTYWSTDGSSNINYRFNEADIDWIVSNAGSTIGNNLNLFRVSRLFPASSRQTETNTTITDYSQHWVPWAFRPNDVMTTTNSGVFGYENNLIGTHLLNVDANCMFSNAINFMPDPMDEYVFRIVCKKGLTGYFYSTDDPSPRSLRSSIILEHGFSSSNYNPNLNPNITGAVTSFQDITDTLFSTTDTFTPGTGIARNAAPHSRIDFSKIKVFVKKETIETIGSDTRYVITLSVLVPRVKSIGYARVFRKFTNTGNDYPQRSSSALDTEIDSGPWNFVFDWSIKSTSNLNDNWQTSNGVTTKAIEDAAFYTFDRTDGSVTGFVVSGRNECAVKFTRVGLPSTLWIRLSVLNTDGSLALLNSAGFSATATSET